MAANEEVLGEVLTEIDPGRWPAVQAALELLIVGAERVLQRPISPRLKHRAHKRTGRRKPATTSVTRTRRSTRT
jgi:hypothetical protein